VLLTITSMTSPVKTQQCILVLAIRFDMKGHDQSEHKIKRIYIHNLYGIWVSKLHSLCCYVGIQDLCGRIAVGNRIY
jgi:hypothetical protein